MGKVIKIKESTLRNMIMEAISYEMEEREAKDIMEYFESQDVSWEGWKEIALQLMNWLGNENLIKWAEANGYSHPFGDEVEPTPYEGDGVYNMSNWQYDKNLDNLKPGTLVSNEVVEELAGAVPPKIYNRHYFQCGEPYSNINGQPVYMSFEINDGDSWKYVGLRPEGE
jgi:hypothetical protein